MKHRTWNIKHKKAERCSMLHAPCSMTKGFTLVELLVVIFIMGVLTAIVMGSISASREKARDVRRVGDIKAIQLALAVYFDVNNNCPAFLSDLTGGGYISVLPTDPVTGGGYSYNCTSQKYCLGTTLEDSATAPSDKSTCTIAVCPSCNYTVQR